jgi:hypothetical protein
MANSELPAENGGTIYWLMQIDPDDRGQGAGVLEQLSSEGSTGVVGYSDRPGDAEAEASNQALRTLFVEEMKPADRIIILQGANEVVCLVEITGDAAQQSANDDGESEPFEFVRNVSVLHRFEFPFRTICHAKGPWIIRASGDPKAQPLVTEVTDAVDGDGFTVEWTLVGLY